MLEAGCGAGHFARALTERYGLRVFPVDLGWEGLRHGKRLGVDRLAQADISQLPFPRGGEYSSVRELARVLAPGGVLAVRVAALAEPAFRMGQSLILLAEKLGRRLRNSKSQIATQSGSSMLDPYGVLR